MIRSSMASVRKSVPSLRVLKRVSKMLLAVIVTVDQTPVIQVINYKRSSAICDLGIYHFGVDRPNLGHVLGRIEIPWEQP